MALPIRLPGRGRRFWIPAAVVILLAACAAIALVPRRTRQPEPPARPLQAIPAADMIYLRGFAYSSSVRGERTFTLKADEVTHRKRKLGPLTLNPIKEVEMHGVWIEIFQGAAPAGGSDSVAPEVDLPIQSILAESLSAKDLGFVSRVLMNRLRVAFLRGRVEQFSIVAGAASAGLDSTALRFEHGVTLSTRSGRQLDAQTAEWRLDSRRLFVPGAFVVQDGRDILRGEGASFLIGPDGDLKREE